MRLLASLDKPLPPQARALVAHVLCRTFARAFHVEPPRLFGKNPQDALHAFREFSAVCMEAALADPDFAEMRRSSLEHEAFDLGLKVRLALNPHDDELMDLVSYLYSTIGIDVDGAIPGELTFHRCYFSGRYSPDLCAFMSGFDSGFVGGICGKGALEFHARITEGAPCCKAAYVCSCQPAQNSTSQ